MAAISSSLLSLIQVASGSGAAGTNINISIPSPQLWSTASPFLYNATVQVSMLLQRLTV